MAKKTISQALKDLFLGLGGDASALADNTSASDYIQDLESAIKTAASGASENLIDDSEASETTVYSSSKVESLIPANELPTPVEANVGKVATVVSDGEGGYQWGAADVPTPDQQVVIFDAEGVTGAPGWEELTIVSHTAQQAKAIIGNDLDPTGKPQKAIYLRYYINKSTGSTGTPLNESVWLRYIGIVDNGSTLGKNAQFVGTYSTYGSETVYYVTVDVSLQSTNYLKGAYYERALVFAT